MHSKTDWKKRIERLKSDEVIEDYSRCVEIIKSTLKDSIKKLIPKQKCGVLFSGGVDSTIIAYLLKKQGFDFTCYSVGFQDTGQKKSEDLTESKKIAKTLGLKQKIIILDFKKVEDIIKKTVKILGPELTNVVNVGVGAVVVGAMQHAKKDGVKRLFGGLGSEEIFAGYHRHEQAKNVNKECWEGLVNMYERDLLRDDAISNHYNIEFLTPFLDEDLIREAMKIPSKYKINKSEKKIVLRDAAVKLGLKKEFAYRPKRAAQYGSRIDKAILKIARRQKMKKSEYLKTLVQNKKLGALISGGKDSLYAMHLMKKKGYKISCIMTMHSANESSYMFHTPNVDLVSLQSKAMNIPLLEFTTKGEKEKELKDLKEMLKKAIDKYQIAGITTGALYSDYQRTRIEKICKELSIECYSPLWHKDQEELMRELLKNRFEFVFSSIAALGLDKTWLGRKITVKDVDDLVKINKKICINIAGEGGEFESLVVDCPMFSKKIKIMDSEIIEEDKNTASLVVKEAKLVLKKGCFL